MSASLGGLGYSSTYGGLSDVAAKFSAVWLLNFVPIITQFTVKGQTAALLVQGFVMKWYFSLRSTICKCITGS